MHKPRGREADSPQQRRRRSFPRRQVLTAAQAGPDLLRRFLARQRMAFFLALVAGLAMMWAGALFEERLPPPSWMILLGAALALWVASALFRLHRRGWQVAGFIAGVCALGAAVGTAAGPSTRALAQASVVVGLPVLGLALNTLLFRRAVRPFVGAVLLGPWLVVAWGIAYFLPAGEMVLAVSGLSGLLAALGLLVTGMQAATIYRPGEYLAAATDVIPLLLTSVWRR